MFLLTVFMCFLECRLLIKVNQSFNWIVFNRVVPDIRLAGYPVSVSGYPAKSVSGTTLVFNLFVPIFIPFSQTLIFGTNCHSTQYRHNLVNVQQIIYWHNLVQRTLNFVQYSQEHNSTNYNKRSTQCCSDEEVGTGLYIVNSYDLLKSLLNTVPV